MSFWSDHADVGVWWSYCGRKPKSPERTHLSDLMTTHHLMYYPVLGSNLGRIGEESVLTTALIALENEKQLFLEFYFKTYLDFKKMVWVRKWIQSPVMPQSRLKCCVHVHNITAAPNSTCNSVHTEVVPYHR